MRPIDLKPEEYATYFSRYISKLKDDTDLVEGFVLGKQSVLAFFAAIPEDKLNLRYEDDKWSIKEVLQHLIDTERIFSYRAFRIARRDQTPLAGYDQTDYVPHSRAAYKTKHELLQEFEAVRDASISLVKSLTPEDLATVGVSSGVSMSARSAAFIIIGHDIWHMEMIQDLYLA